MEVKITNSHPTNCVFIHATVNFSLPHFLLFFTHAVVVCSAFSLYCFFLFHIHHNFLFSFFPIPLQQRLFAAQQIFFRLRNQERSLLISHTYAHRCTHRHTYTQPSIRYLFVSFLCFFPFFLFFFVFAFSIGGLCIWGYHSENFIVSLGDKHAFIIFPMLPRLNGNKGVLPTKQG